MSTIIGTAGADTISPDFVSPGIAGRPGAGADLIYDDPRGSTLLVAPILVADLLAGGDGADTLIASGGADTLRGGAGDDVLAPFDVAAFIDGGEGYDTIDLRLLPYEPVFVPEKTVTRERLKNPFLYGAETITWTETIHGAFYRYPGLEFDFTSGAGLSGVEAIIGTIGIDHIIGPADAPMLINAGALDPDTVSETDYAFWQLSQMVGETLQGGAFADTIQGAKRADLLFGGGGNDILTGGYGQHGGDGDDLLIGGFWNSRAISDQRGGAGNDTLVDGTLQYGGAGDDRLVGSRGYTTMDGEAGNDTLRGHRGDDNVEGGEGHDIVDGGVGADTLKGGDGNDTLIGGLGNDSLFGGAGANRLDGGAGHDTLRGDSGFDRLFGGDGNDSLDAGIGADLLRGGAGDDTLRGGLGDDRLHGEDGADTFLFADLSDGADTIFDWRAEDVIDVTGFVPLDYIAGAAFTGAAAELRHERIAGTTRVEIDVDGDAVSDFLIMIARAVTLTRDDFAIAADAIFFN
jgi:Ca2+-binding RTX toxin-like protein